MPVSRRVLVRHAIALDFVVLAAGIVLLLLPSPALTVGTFLLAATLAAWFGQEEAGLAATAYAVLVLAIWFSDTVDATTLTVFGATGAVLSSFVRAARRQPTAVPPPGPLAVPLPVRAGLPFAIGLPLVVLAVYTGVSNLLMKLYHLPSLLQPAIVLVTVAVIRFRREYRPASALQQPVPWMLGAFAFILFASSVWAADAALVDDRFGEALKCLIICCLVGSLGATWSSLRRGLTALVAAAALFSIFSLIQVFTGHLDNALGGLIHVKLGNIYGGASMPRASGPPVDDPNFYARILLVAIPPAFAVGLAQRARWRRFIFFGAGLLITAGTLVSYSRGAMIALAVMGGLFILAAHLRMRTVALGLAAVAVAAVLLPASVRQRFFSLGVLLPGQSGVRQESSVESRKIFGHTALLMFERNPLAGVGGGNFSRHYEEYSREAGTTAFSYDEIGTVAFSHSLVLEIGAESGLVGLAAFFGAIGWSCVSLWRARRTLTLRGAPAQAALATALVISIAGYLVASIVLHESYLRYVGLLLGFAVSVMRLTGARVQESAA